MISFPYDMLRLTDIHDKGPMPSTEPTRPMERKSFKQHIIECLVIHTITPADAEEIVKQAQRSSAAGNLKHRDWEGPNDAPEVSGVTGGLIWKIVEKEAINWLKTNRPGHMAIEILESPMPRH